MNTKDDDIAGEECPLCSSKAVEGAAFEILDHVNLELYNLAACTQCSHKWVTNPPHRDRLSDHYQNEMGVQMRSRPTRLFEIARQIRMKREFSYLERYVGKIDRLVDIGCGDGAFLRSAGAAVNRTGVDLHVPDRTDGRNDGITFLAQALPISMSNPALIGHLDKSHCVLRHVLEHSPDPINLLTELHQAGSQSISLTVPNASSLIARLSKQYWYYWDPPRHLHYFNERSIRYALDKAGWSVVDLTYQTVDEVISSFFRACRISKRINSPRMERLFFPTGILAGPFNLLPAAVMKSALVVVAKRS